MSSSDMSSSAPRRQPPQATPWSLDELEMPDIFVPFGQSPHTGESEPADEPVEEVSASPQERARIEAAAYAHGRADGEKIARAECKPKIEAAVGALTDALQHVTLHQARWIANVEENLAVLAVAIARNLIAREVDTASSVVSELVQRALQQFPLDQQVTVRLHPDEVEFCETHHTGNARDVRWTADTLVQRGGCMVEGRERIVDGRVDTALERVYRIIGNVQA